MNSFLISFCPFTSSSSSFRVFTFRVFKEFFRDFRCLLLDLELRKREEESILEDAQMHPGGLVANRCHSRSANIKVHFRTHGHRETPHPAPALHTKKQRKSWECPRCPLPQDKPTEKKRMIRWKYGSDDKGCQLNR